MAISLGIYPIFRQTHILNNMSFFPGRCRNRSYSKPLPMYTRIKNLCNLCIICGNEDVGTYTLYIITELGPSWIKMQYEPLKIPLSNFMKYELDDKFHVTMGYHHPLFSIRQHKSLFFSPVNQAIFFNI